MPTLLRQICLVLPTLLTLSALGCGLTSVLSAIDGKFENSYWFLFASAMLDGMDGHVARALKATSAIGAELDSLCDLVDFGVSPAFVLLMWCRHTTRGLPRAWYESDGAIWACCLVYVSGCAFRLARFNLDDKVPAPQPPHSVNFKALDPNADGEALRAKLTAAGLPPADAQTEKTWLDQYVNRAKFFQGIPAPAAALLSLLPVVYWLEYEHTEPFPVRTVVPAVYLIVAILMVSRFRTFSSKMLIKGPVNPADPHTSHLRSKSKLTLILKVVAVVAVLWVYVSYPYKVHIFATCMYIATLPLSHFVYAYLLTEPSKHK